uniref:S8_pro-domain domain-containing protein n=1 Tax=Steinernema glaseri TaxID=37863 RepID=A0A1I8AIQ5_9BILA
MDNHLDRIRWSAAAVLLLALLAVWFTSFPQEGVQEGDDSPSAMVYGPFEPFLQEHFDIYGGVKYDKSSEVGDDHHLVIRLKERDDALARKIADEHDMVLKGSPLSFFEEVYYSLKHSQTNLSRQRKQEVIDSLRAHPDVRQLIVSPLKKRVKRI